MLGKNHHSQITRSHSHISTKSQSLRSTQSASPHRRKRAIKPQKPWLKATIRTHAGPSSSKTSKRYDPYWKDTWFPTSTKTINLAVPSASLPPVCGVHSSANLPQYKSQADQSLPPLRVRLLSLSFAVFN